MFDCVFSGWAVVLAVAGLLLGWHVPQPWWASWAQAVIVKGFMIATSRIRQWF